MTQILKIYLFSFYKQVYINNDKMYLPSGKGATPTTEVRKEITNQKLIVKEQNMNKRKNITK